MPSIFAKTAGVPVDIYTAKSAIYGANVHLADFLSGNHGYAVPLPMPEVEVKIKKLVEVADLDNLLG